MTNTEFFEAIMKAGFSEEITEHAKNELKKIDERNKKRAESAKNVENEALIGKIIEAIPAHTIVTAASIASRFDISTQKASAMLRKLEERGEFKSSVGRNPDTSKGKCKLYEKIPHSTAAVDEDEDVDDPIQMLEKEKDINF